MAVYEYICPTCSFYLEVNKAMKDINTDEWCPICGARLEKQFPSKTGGAIFKAKGFYKTDSKVRQK